MTGKVPIWIKVGTQGEWGFELRANVSEEIADRLAAVGLQIVKEINEESERGERRSNSFTAANICHSPFRPA